VGVRADEQDVFELQPDTIVNNRNKLPGDFSTPKQRIVAETGDQTWESRMTLNDSWGYQRADDNWKRSKTIIRNLISCAQRWHLPVEHRPKPDAVRGNTPT
jgi:alpha-L-fucosidase